MTTRPQLRVGRHLVSGIVAVVFFGLLAVSVLSSNFGDPAGYPEGESIVANIGYALLNIDAGAIASEGFLVALLALAVLLDAALGGAVMLAWRDDREDDS